MKHRKENVDNKFYIKTLSEKIIEIWNSSYHLDINQTKNSYLLVLKEKRDKKIPEYSQNYIKIHLSLKKTQYNIDYYQISNSNLGNKTYKLINSINVEGTNDIKFIMEDLKKMMKNRNSNDSLPIFPL